MYDFKWQNNGNNKICIGLGTRPEIIRLAAVIKRCREYFDCCVIYYNQNWDKQLSTVFWEDFELKNNAGEFGPDILVPVVGDNLGVTCGNILGRSYGYSFLLLQLHFTICAIENYIRFYNTKRYQFKLHCMTPMVFHAAFAA